MSLILDALKKSDQARQRGRSLRLESPHVPQPAPPRKPARRYSLPVALALCLNAVLLVWWLRPWEPGVVAKGAREQAPAAQALVAQATQTMQGTQATQASQSTPATHRTQSAQATQATKAAQTKQSAQATQVTQVASSSDSAGEAKTAQSQGPGESRNQDDRSRIALAGSVGDKQEMKPEAATVDHGQATELTTAATSEPAAASGRMATVRAPGPDVAPPPTDETPAVSVKGPEDVSREGAPPVETASADPAPVPPETVAATTTTQPPAQPLDTSRGAARVATARVNEASPSGSTAEQASPAVAGQNPLGAAATAVPAPPKTTPPPARQAVSPQKTASVLTAKVKEADPPRGTAGQSPPSVAGNVRPSIPQAERPSPAGVSRDAAPVEPAKTAKQKPPGKAVKAGDGEKSPAEGAGYPGPLGGSRELVSDLKSLMGADDSPKKAPSSGKVLKYYQLPSSVRDSLPKLSMSMLLHSKKSEERWVNINGAKVREGQEIASGLKVEEITPDGAIFAYKGQRFYKAVMGD